MSADVPGAPFRGRLNAGERLAARLDAYKGRDCVVLAISRGAQMIRKHDPERIAVAVPVSPQSSIDRVGPFVDELVCLVVRDTYHFAVAGFYQRWRDLTDEEVIEYLRSERSAE